MLHEFLYSSEKKHLHNIYSSPKNLLGGKQCPGSPKWSISTSMILRDRVATGWLGVWSCLEECSHVSGKITTIGLLFNLPGDFSTCSSEHTDHKGFPRGGGSFLDLQNPRWGDTWGSQMLDSMRSCQSMAQVHLSCSRCVLHHLVSLAGFLWRFFSGQFFGRKKEPTFCQNGVSWLSSYMGGKKKYLKRY